MFGKTGPICSWNSEIFRLNLDKINKMERTPIKAAIKELDQTVTLSGRVEVTRNHGSLIFFDLYDFSGSIQVVVDAGQSELAELKLSPQSAVKVTGVVKKRDEKYINPKIPTGAYEVKAERVEVLSSSESLPFDIDSDLQIETYLDNAPLTLRSRKSRAVFKVQSAIAKAFVDFFYGEGFTWVQTPKIVASATEGGTNLFEIKYFEGKAYLAQSPQLYKQIMVGVFERVFEIAPVFRAEPHSTTRHINEYVSLDMEMAFIDSYQDIIEMGNKFFRFLSDRLADCSDELALFNVELPAIPKEVPQMTFVEAKNVLKQEFDRDLGDDPDFEPGDEKKLGEYAKTKFNSDFLWVTEYPTSKRPFYTYVLPDNPEYTGGVDLIFKGIEIISGGQRENDYHRLVAAIQTKGLKPENFDYYLDAFKYGMPPEGGFAIGLERLTAKMLGVENIREATLFPRDIHRVTPWTRPYPNCESLATFG